ncbi:MAG TPA: THUMP domain-containing protein, partial [Pseudothermotoga sp.]
MEFVALCSSGLEGAVCIELRKHGFKIKMVTAGHVHFSGQIGDIPLLNLSLNSADRILVHMVSFEAQNFDDLYEGVYSA